MLTTLRRYRLPAALAALGLLLSAFAPCAMPMGAPDAEVPAEVHEAMPPCHDAMAMEHEAPEPEAPAEAPCAPDDCCTLRAPTAPRTEPAPSPQAASVLLLAAIADVLPSPAPAPRRVPIADGPSPPTVALSILYGCFLI